MINLTVLSRAMAGHLAGATGLARERIDTLRFGLEIILGALIKGLVLLCPGYFHPGGGGAGYGRLCSRLSPFCV